MFSLQKGFEKTNHGFPHLSQIGSSSWSPSMRSVLPAEDPKSASQNVSIRNDKRGSVVMKDGKLFITSRRRSAAGPSMRSTAVEPEGLGVGNLTYDIARIKSSTDNLDVVAGVRDMP